MNKGDIVLIPFPFTDLRTHKDLDVYKMAFDAAMRIFEITKSFPTEEKYALRIRSEDHPGRSVRIWPRLSVNENILNHLYQNLMIQKEKLLKHKYGLIFLLNAII